MKNNGYRRYTAIALAAFLIFTSLPTSVSISTSYSSPSIPLQTSSSSLIQKPTPSSSSPLHHSKPSSFIRLLRINRGGSSPSQPRSPYSNNDYPPPPPPHSQSQQRQQQQRYPPPPPNPPSPSSPASPRSGSGAGASDSASSAPAYQRGSEPYVSSQPPQSYQPQPQRRQQQQQQQQQHYNQPQSQLQPQPPPSRSATSLSSPPPLPSSPLSPSLPNSNSQSQYPSTPSSFSSSTPSPPSSSSFFSTIFSPPSSTTLAPASSESLPSQSQSPNQISQSSQSQLDLTNFDKDKIFQNLFKLYKKKILPLELSSRYSHFTTQPLVDSDFTAKPMVLLLGGYSVGKTSFVKYLVGRKWSGMRVGAEPTTDRFCAIMERDRGSNSNKEAEAEDQTADRVIPGAALASQSSKPFTGLTTFGNSFLSRFEAIELSNVPILSNITLIDTPGILSGSKQINRSYNYASVMDWFALRSDLIVIMFDCSKLDISDELKAVLQSISANGGSDKIRVLLNKSDEIGGQELMRVYGALMWGLGKVFKNPEVVRVYVGSFWDKPLKNTEASQLLIKEKQDLLNDISNLPLNAVLRRVNDLVKRCRAIKVHCYLIHYLRKQMPYTSFGRAEKIEKLAATMDAQFRNCARRYNLPLGDFPDLAQFRGKFLEMRDFPNGVSKIDKRAVGEMDGVFGGEVWDLLGKGERGKKG